MDWTLVPWGTLTPGVLLAGVVIAIIRGDLRTHRELTEILRTSAREIKALTEDRDHWKQVAMTLLQATMANTEAAQAVSKVLATMEQKARTE